MNTMKNTEFSPWWIRATLTRMVNRKMEYEIDRAPLSSKRGNYTWVNSCNRSINKMKYRFQEYKSGGVQKDEWSICINYQITKLHRRYDPVYLWSITEFYNCEKVNIDGLSQDMFPCLVWKFKSIEQAVDITKRLQCNTSLQRTDHFVWGNLIGNVKRKLFTLKHEEDLADENDEFWNYCFRANREKLEKIRGYASWDSRYWQNKRKIDRWQKFQERIKVHGATLNNDKSYYNLFNQKKFGE